MKQKKKALVLESLQVPLDRLSEILAKSWGLEKQKNAKISKDPNTLHSTAITLKNDLTEWKTDYSGAYYKLPKPEIYLPFCRLLDALEKPFGDGKRLSDSQIKKIRKRRNDLARAISSYFR